MAVPSSEKPVPEKKAGKLPLTPAEKARRAYRNQIIVIVMFLILALAALAVGFVELVLPYAKPPSDEALMLEAKFKQQQQIGRALNISLQEAENISGNRTDPALSRITIGRWDPFNDLRPEPPPPEPQWPSVRYAGVIRSLNKLYAIVEVEQSTYSARVGDTLIGDILVTRISESKMTLSYKGYQREFDLGGESK